MKITKLILSGVIATAFASGSFAQSGTISETTAVIAVEEPAVDAVTSDDEGTEIKLSELPLGVQTALKTEPYNTWIKKRAWIVTRPDSKLYRVEVENPKGESTTILFDGTGKVVD